MIADVSPAGTIAISFTVLVVLLGLIVWDAKRKEPQE